MNSSEQPTDPEPTTQPTESEQAGEKPSKKAQKKAEKEAAKEAAKKAKQEELAAQQKAKENEIDPLASNYGDYELIQSQEKTDRKWTKVKNVDESVVGQKILVRARVHNARVKGNVGFLVLREQFSDLQAIISVKEGQVSKKMMKFVEQIPNESIVDIYGEVVNPKDPIISCSQKVELSIERIYVISRSANLLPFQLKDASRPIEKGEIEMENYEQTSDKHSEKSDSKESKEETKENQVIKVNLKTRLDHRTLDLRTKANQAIFRVSSGVSQLFREFLYQNEFVEIHTPKLIAGSSEGGANVFKLKYFNQDGCLAQSPQLYKQMCVMADFDRVFEVGPVFRAEQSFTPRHMCEFTGLDLEMAIKENYHEVLDLLGELFAYIFEGLESRYAKELAAINEQFPYDKFLFKRPVVKLTYEEGCELLKSAGIEQSVHEDLSTVNEKKLGAIVREKYETDFYILHRYPIGARPFYTMPCKDDPKFTNSYDLFMRGEEIISGAQRIHEPELLTKRAEECGIKVETIKDYIEAFKYGAFPHGGAGVGLERVVMFYCALGNIRKSSLFPRDPLRITP